MKEEPKDKEKRKYQKADNAYWENKTAKAGKRKAQKEKLQHYAGLMAKASKIGSAVYRSLPAAKRHRGQYRSITGLAMQWLKEGLLEEEVRALLMEEVGMKDPKNKKQETNKIQNTKPEVVIPCQMLAKCLAKDAVRSTKIYIPVRRMGSVFCIPRVQSSSTKRNRLRQNRSLLSMPP